MFIIFHNKEEIFKANKDTEIIEFCDKYAKNNGVLFATRNKKIINDTDFEVFYRLSRSHSLKLLIKEY